MNPRHRLSAQHLAMLAEHREAIRVAFDASKPLAQIRRSLPRPILRDAFQFWLRVHRAQDVHARIFSARRNGKPKGGDRVGQEKGQGRQAAPEADGQEVLAPSG